MPTDGTASDTDVDAFFRDTPPPDDLEAVRASLDAFVALHSKAGRRVVCVTSGGTTVPLERNTVRFLDNFSAGTRGAASAEEFLRAGYAVIFLHRRHSLAPFSRHLAHTAHSLLDSLVFEADGSVGVSPSELPCVERVLKEYTEVKRAGTLLPLPYTSVHEYLYALRAVASAISPMGPAAMLYLAAAVSDFYVPWKDMVEHKIQSGDGGLTLQLAKVPKLLGTIRHEWAPRAFCISFKLETDIAMLELKSRQALQRYGVDLVIANLLHTRKDEVWLAGAGRPLEVLRRREGLRDIEADLIPALRAIHDGHIAAASAVAAAGGPGGR
eukprot:tig00000792_g4166.t1